VVSCLSCDKKHDEPFGPSWTTIPGYTSLLKATAMTNLTAEFDLSNVGGSEEDKRLQCSAVFFDSELMPTNTRT